jgi:hypothetical protein
MIIYIYIYIYKIIYKRKLVGDILTRLRKGKKNDLYNSSQGVYFRRCDGHIMNESYMYQI